MQYNKANLLVAGMASDSDIKPVFNAVLFKNGVSCATDSARLVEVSAMPDDEPATDHAVIIPKETIERVIRNAKDPQTIVNVKPEGMLQISSPKIGVIDERVQPLHDEFPDYGQLFDDAKDRDHAVARVNPALFAETLATLAKIAKTCAGLQQLTIEIDKKSEHSPIVFKMELSTGQIVRALHMPLHK